MKHTQRSHLFQERLLLLFSLENGPTQDKRIETNLANEGANPQLTQVTRETLHVREQWRETERSERATEMEEVEAKMFFEQVINAPLRWDVVGKETHASLAYVFGKLSGDEKMALYRSLIQKDEERVSRGNTPRMLDPGWVVHRIDSDMTNGLLHNTKEHIAEYRAMHDDAYNSREDERMNRLRAEHRETDYDRIMAKMKILAREFYETHPDEYASMKKFHEDNHKYVVAFMKKDGRTIFKEDTADLSVLRAAARERLLGSQGADKSLFKWKTKKIQRALRNTDADAIVKEDVEEATDGKTALKLSCKKLGKRERDIVIDWAMLYCGEDRVSVKNDVIEITNDDPIAFDRFLNAVLFKVDWEHEKALKEKEAKEGRQPKANELS